MVSTVEATGPGYPPVSIETLWARDYFCPFQIAGLGDERVRYAAGIDSVQALQLVMTMVGAYLFALNESCDRGLRWDGDEKGHLGLSHLRGLISIDIPPQVQLRPVMTILDDGLKRGLWDYGTSEASAEVPF